MIEQRVWFGIIFAFFCGAIAASYEPKNTDQEIIATGLVMIAMVVIYRFAVHKGKPREND